MSRTDIMSAERPAANERLTNGRSARTAMAVVVQLWSTVASAQPVPAPPAASDFAPPEPACIEWTNICRICTLTDAGTPACSNVGIACQAESSRCTRYKEEKKEEKENKKENKK